MFVYFFAMGAAMFVYIFAMTAAILNYETLKIAQLQKKHICVFSRESWIYGYLLPCTPSPRCQKCEIRKILKKSGRGLPGDP